MELILLLLVLLLALGIAAVHWGADSTDKMNSPEWNRKEAASSRLMGLIWERQPLVLVRFTVGQTMELLDLVTCV